MTLRWVATYATGVEEVDEQHQMLFDFVNKLETTLKTGEGKDEVEGILRSLGSYAKSLLTLTEMCKFQNTCPLVNTCSVGIKNKDAHSTFLAAYEQLVERFGQEGPTDLLLMEIHRTAETWLVSHICEVDDHLKYCVKAA